MWFQLIPILIFIVPLLDSTIVIDWKSFFCRSDLSVATSKSTVWMPFRHSPGRSYK